MNMDAATKISNIIMDLSLQQSASRENMVKNPVVIVPQNSKKAYEPRKTFQISKLRENLAQTSA